MPQMDPTVFFSVVETLFYSFFFCYLTFQLFYALQLFNTVKSEFYLVVSSFFVVFFSTSSPWNSSKI
jgi:hypothetical protein